MANITTYLSNIKNAVLGKEVRGSIHDGIKAINDEVEGTTKSQNTLSEQFKNLIINAGNSNAEVAASRGSYDYLPDRLDAVDEQFNTIKSEKVSKGEGGVITNAMLSQEVKETMTGGSVAVVGRDAILAENIVDGVVSEDKTSFFQDCLNLINPNTIETDKVLYSTNGTVVASTNWATTDFIEVNPNLTYKLTPRADGSSYYCCFAFYTKDKTFISITSQGEKSEVTTVENAKYIKISVFQKTSSTFNLLLTNFSVSTAKQPKNGSKFEYREQYIQNDKIEKSDKINKYDNRLITSQVIYDSYKELPMYGENLNMVDSTTIVNGVLNNGNLITGGNYYTSDFIEVETSTDYHFLKLNESTPYYGKVAFYTDTKSFISETSEGSFYSFTTPNNAKYIRISIAGFSNGSANVTKINLCKSVLKLPYFNGSALYPYNHKFIKNDFIDLQGNFGWKFKHMTTFGDSLIAMGRWQEQVRKYFNMLHTNCGQGGSRVSGENYVASDQETKIPMWKDERINKIPTYTDLIIIHGGTNDKGLMPTNLGQLKTDGVYDTNTFYGAYQTMLEKMILRCPNAVIVLLQPFWNIEEKDGILDNTIRKAIREIGDYYGFQVIESKKIFGFNYKNYTSFYIDSTHVNYAGGNRVANILIGILKTIAPYYDITKNEQIL